MNPSGPSVKVAQPGWNVSTAPDWALVFSSDWPSLQIAFETTITIAANNALAFSVSHNLNYCPLSSAWITVNNISYGRVTNLLITQSTISAIADLGIPTLSAESTITIRCYNVDITADNSYPLPSSSYQKASPDLTTGIRIVKQNPTRNINSPNLNDFILNSLAQSPAVLTVATQNGQYFDGSTITYPLMTPYIPWAIAFTGQTAGVYVSNLKALTYISDSNSLALSVPSIASLVILRDPLFYPNTVRVVY